jgi:hypothetical protein
MRVYALTAMLLAIFIAGCGSAQPAPLPHVEKPLPSWYLNPPKGDNRYLYGVGEAATRNDAVKSALDDLISQLGISIGSSYRSSTSVERGYREYYTQNIQTGITGEVQRLHISRYEVVDAVRQRYDSYYALVRVEKSTLEQELRTRIEAVYKTVRDNDAQLAQSSVPRKYGLYAASLRALDGNRSAVSALTSLVGGDTGQTYFNMARKTRNAFAHFKSGLSVSIEAASGAKAFANVVRAAFAEKKITVVTVPPARGSDMLYVHLQENTIYTQAYGFDIANVTLTTTVKERSGAIVGSNRLTLTGHSPQGREKAFENSAEKLKQVIEKEGVMKTIGVDMALE